MDVQSTQENDGTAQERQNQGFGDFERSRRREDSERKWSGEED